MSDQPSVEAVSSSQTASQPVNTIPAPPALHNPTLEDAWQRFAKYDRNARIAQQQFLRQRRWILILGVAATTLAVSYSLLERYLKPDFPNQPLVLQGVHALVVVAPIVLSVLTAGAVKFNMGVSWVMLRSSAETLKKEIYRYRTQVQEYRPNPALPNSRDVELAHRVKIISKRLMETQVNQTGLQPYQGDLPPRDSTAWDDDGFSDLSAEQYLIWRVEDQFSYYQKKAVRLSKELQQFQWSIYILGGIGTLLAAFGFDIWIAVSSALATAFASYLEFKRVETNVVSCNLAAADLYDLRTWWRSLSDTAKTDQLNLETLVAGAESVLQTENAGWLQEMRDALAELYGEQTSEEEKNGQKSKSGKRKIDDLKLADPTLDSSTQNAPKLKDSKLDDPELDAKPCQ